MFKEDTEKIMRLVEERTGYRVQVGTTEESSSDAEMISAAEDHPTHIINVSNKRLRFSDYIVAVQCSIILTMWSHPSGVPQFAPNVDKINDAISKAKKWRALAKLPAAQSEKVANILVTGLLHQLRSTPFELIAIEYCYKECPGLREMQAEVLSGNLRRNTAGLKPELKEMTPPDLYRANLAMSAVLAQFWCDISGDRLAMLPYQSVGMEENAKSLLGMFNNCPGTDGERCVATVDLWAEEMGIDRLYTWRYRSKQ